ncbi:hypothetical protein BJY00DRAFT_217016 [Aspergillus carlsbadensis]|nr:hypothetical protein BJY00DRAFT_217016 [Aspergillus carlsbadensis]
MIVIIPILVILAGIAILLRRRYLAQREQEGPRVVVKGHTYSEAAESKPICVAESPNRAGDVSRCCMIGAGRTGVTTAIILAANNPHVQFVVVDTDARLVAAWKSDCPPIADPALEDIFFDDACLAIAGPGNDATTIIPATTAAILPPKTEPEVIRRRRLQNLAFSSDIHESVAVAQMVFLCLEMDESDTSFAYLDPTLASIASASKDAKIIVHRSSAPYGVVRHIKDRLESLTPNIHHTILTNPLPSLSFSPSASGISSNPNEARVIIGHIYSPSSRPEDIDALKKLYTPFIPAEHIVTMDAYSAELGRIGGMAMAAQQIGSLASLRVLGERCEASQGAVGWMLGSDTADNGGNGTGSQISGVMGLGGGFRGVRSEVKCLVNMARELGMEEVAEYWGSVLKMQGFMVRRAVKGLIDELGTTEEGKKATIAALGLDEEREMGRIVIKELINAGLNVRVVVDGSLKSKVQDELGEAVDVVDSIETACSGSSGVVCLSSTGAQMEALQAIARNMKDRRLLSLGGGLDGVRMRQLGFEIL